jgi:hypothetical protein
MHTVLDAGEKNSSISQNEIHTCFKDFSENLSGKNLCLYSINDADSKPGRMDGHMSKQDKKYKVSYAKLGHSYPEDKYPFNSITCIEPCIKLKEIEIEVRCLSNQRFYSGLNCTQ